jgi:protein-tyrosine phosphatase
MARRKRRGAAGAHLGPVTTATRRTSRARQILKHAYDATRNLPDRVLHRRRHLAVRRRLARAQTPRKILVVCHGNICRSPYLQAVLQRALPDLAVMSAGFVGSDRAVPEISVTLSAKRGLDLSRYRSRPLTQSIVSNADLVIVMDSDQARQLARMFPINRARVVIAGDLDPRFDASRAITDPWNRTKDVFEMSFDRLDRCATTLVSVLQRPNRGVG